MIKRLIGNVHRDNDQTGGVLKEFLGGDVPLGPWNP